MREPRYFYIKSIESYKGFTIKFGMASWIFGHESRLCRVYNGDTLIATFNSKKEAKAQIDAGNIEC